MSKAHLSLRPGNVTWWESKLDHGSDLLSKSPDAWLSTGQSAFFPPPPLLSSPNSTPFVVVLPGQSAVLPGSAQSLGQCRGTCKVAGCQLSLSFMQLSPLYHIWRVFLYGVATQGGGDLSIPLWFSVELLAWCTYMSNSDRERNDQLGILCRHANYLHKINNHWEFSERRKLFRQHLKYSDKISNSDTAFDRKAENNL